MVVLRPPETYCYFSLMVPGWRSHVPLSLRLRNPCRRLLSVNSPGWRGSLCQLAFFCVKLFLNFLHTPTTLDKSQVTSPLQCCHRMVNLLDIHDFPRSELWLSCNLLIYYFPPQIIGFSYLLFSCYSTIGNEFSLNFRINHWFIPLFRWITQLLLLNHFYFHISGTDTFCAIIRLKWALEWKSLPQSRYILARSIVRQRVLK